MGSASGVLNAIQQLGAVLGIAVLATIFFACLDDPSSPMRAMADTTLLSLVPLGLAFLAAFRLPRQARAESAGADQRGASPVHRCVDRISS